MLSRRRLLKETLRASSMVALGGAPLGFVARTANAAKPGKDTVLVIVELDGGNDGLSTVVPYTDDNYKRARPTLAFDRNQILKLDDSLGLNPGLQALEGLWQEGKVAIVQGVGYPDPMRSHLESRHIWQTADPTQKTSSGWVARCAGLLADDAEAIPSLYVGTSELPIALSGTALGVPAVHYSKPYRLRLDPHELVPESLRPQLDTDAALRRSRGLESKRALVEQLARGDSAHEGNLLQFVRRRALQTYATVDALYDLTEQHRRLYPQQPRSISEAARGQSLRADLGLVARIITADLGTRVFYVAFDGFDTHSRQRRQHESALQEVGRAIGAFFQDLADAGHEQRVILATFSEFGRRVAENASGGTDHGGGSCLFIVGPRVRGGLVGAHPRLDQLVQGDLAHHTDFRQVYATLIDQWLGCDSVGVLGSPFSHLPLVKGLQA
jgi:uncharacterized protein (DUF1501 family)